MVAPPGGGLLLQRSSPLCLCVCVLVYSTLSNFSSGSTRGESAAHFLFDTHFLFDNCNYHTLPV